MAKLTPLYLFFFFFFFFFPLSLQAVNSDDGIEINFWCNQTPYTQLCKYFMSHTPPSFTPKHKLDFQKMSIQAAMERARHAQARMLELRKACRNDLERTAWADCLELYEDTILQLNNTLEAGARTQEDIQTWLSAALTNQETCRAGFIELGVSSYMLPLMANNVSQMISNCLAINKLTAVEGRRLLSGGFPVWVSVGDRQLLQSWSAAAANVVVAQDGSGNFRSIQEAVVAVGKSRSGDSRFVIYVKGGVYKENVVISSSMENLMFIGDGIGETIVTGSKSVQGGSTTFSSATFAVSGDGFIAIDMTFRNTAGATNHQAVALRVASDHSVFYRCSMEGYQDTLYTYSLRQFYRECDIYGTVDFILGNSAVVFQNCNIYIRKPMPQQKNTVTAQGRTDPNQNTGISIQSSNVTAAQDLKPVQGSFQSFLGRPWQEYSQTVFLETFLDGLIDPAGWLEWNGSFALETLFYGEYKNSGPGSGTRNRVNWTGYHVITDPSQASRFTVGGFISGGSWIPSNVPSTSGL